MDQTDLTYLGGVLSLARTLWKIESPRGVVDEAREALRHMGLLARSNERDRRPTDDELAQLIAQVSMMAAQYSMPFTAALALYRDLSDPDCYDGATVSDPAVLATARKVHAHLDPEILIVDEVLAVGDASFQKKCLGKMQDVAQHPRVTP